MKTYKGLMFIGDVMLSNTRPNRRLDENFCEIAFKKLETALNIAKNENLKPIIIGNLTKKSFEISIYSKLINLLSNRDVLMIAGSNEYKGSRTLINQHSTAKLLHDSRIIKLSYESEITEKISIRTPTGEKVVCLYSCPERQVAPTNIGIKEGVKKGEIVALLIKGNSNHELNEELDSSIEKEPFEWPGCDILVTEKPHQSSPIKIIGNCTWLNTGPLVRHKIEHENIEPKIWLWQPGSTPDYIKVEHEKHIFDTEGLTSDYVQESYSNSEFTKLLKNESQRAKNESNNNTFIEKELKEIFLSQNTSPEGKEIIFDLLGKASDPANALEGIF